MRFKYHQPIPNLYNFENPHHPSTTVSDDFLEEFTDIAKDSQFAGLSYSKLSDEFKREWDIEWDNVIILKYFMSDEILKMEPSKEKCRLEDKEFHDFAYKTFALADFLRKNGFKADLLNPIDDRVSLRAIAMQSNDAVITRNNMCMFKEGVNLGLFMIHTSIENLPFKTENDMEWVSDYCSTCGVCFDRCPENAFDSNDKVLRKVCTAHKEGCSQCILFCPFYKRGYEKVKKKIFEDEKMNEKIALVSCSGLSPLGLVVRAASVELALENENIVAACITEYSAQPNNCSPILDDAKIVTITGCGDDCASVILKEKEVDSVKNISADAVVKTYDLNPLDAVRLDEDGEKAVDILKKYILKELENI